MKKSIFAAAAAVLVIVLAVTGCSSGPATVETLGSGDTSVSIRTSNYAFDPNVIQVPQTGRLSLQVTNTSGTQHNITIVNPTGEVIGSRDIPPGQTITLNVELTQPGTYEYRSNNLVHTQFGMRGTLKVGQ